MNLRIVVLFVSSLLCASACGPMSVCDRLPATQRALTQKRGSCAITLSLSSPTACDSAFADNRCGASDAAAIGRLYDCYERMSNCVPGAEPAFMSQLNSCNSGAASSTAASCRF